MQTKELYQKMEKDFKLSEIKDDWSHINFDSEFVTENFRIKFMGVLLDNIEEIQKVYTAVFPSEKVLEEILNRGEKNVLLFTHHPVDWKITLGKSPFVNYNRDTLQKLKKSKISIYALHTPLDRNGEYSTSKNFSKALDLIQVDEFAEYFGFLSGVIGKTDCENIFELAEKFEKTVGHKVKIYNYGNSEIKNKKVAVVGGGGCDADILSELVKLKINTLVTGVTFHNNYEPSVQAHEIAKENGINMIGGTHYSTEKFAFIKMLEYFKKQNLPSEFLEDEPDMEDLG